MSLRVSTSKIERLNWDPSKTNPTEAEEGETSRFEWAIDHRKQIEGDWCWAACMSNALSCFGRYVDQADIVDRFFRDHGSSPELMDDKRIPSPELVTDLWRSFGFDKPTWQDKQEGKDEPMPFKALAEEIATNGPVQIELWRKEDDKNRHLALIYGVRETTAGPKVCVSDPYSVAPKSYAYDQMRGPNPLPSNFGEWRRTYLNRGFQRGYLRRFFGRPTQYLADLAAEGEVGTNGDTEPTVQPVKSALIFERPRNPLALRQELALATYGYRHYRYRSESGETRKKRRAELGRSLFLFESIPVWQAPVAIQYDGNLEDQLLLYRWHHQIYDAKGPRYYAHSQFFKELQQRLDSGWRTVWLGESWMAMRVDEAIRRLDADFGDREEEVRMVWFHRHGLVTLYLTESDLHLVVSAHSESQKDFPLFTRFTDDQLRETLRGLSV